VADAVAGIGRLGGGALADDSGRRRSLAVGGYTATAVLSAGIGGATAVWQVAILRTGAWAARGLRVPARNALLADMVAPSSYGRAYGFERAMDNVGAIVGPLAAIGLLSAVGTRWAIALSVIPGLLAAAAIVYAIRHVAATAPVERQPLRLRIGPVLTGRLRPLFAGVTAFEAGNCAATLLILRAVQLLEPQHGEGRATTIALLLYAGYNFAATVASLLGGRYTDRIGARRVLIVGVGGFALAYAGFARDTASWVALAPLFALAGAGIGCVETAQHAAVAACAPEHLRGSAFGLLAGVQSFGNLAASGIAGVVWTAFSPSWAFAYLTAWMVVAGAALSRASD